MPHALIEAGVVVQLDLTGSPPEKYIECPDHVQPGFTYDGEWHAPVAPSPAAPTSYTLPKTEPWRRMTEQEAADVWAAMQAAPPRLRAIYDAAQYLHTDDEFFPQLRAMLAAVVGDDRVGELLAPVT